MSHCQDEDLVGRRSKSTRVPFPRVWACLAWPAQGEEIQIARDIELAKLTGAKLHIQHISTAYGLELVRRAKEEGIEVTCEATPHHMFLSEDDLDETYNTSLKVNPPLRTQADAEAIRQGVIDGTVDVIVTDHAPHAAWEKSREFELAPFGMTGLETSLALVLTNMVRTGKMGYDRLVEAMSIAPRRILGLDPVSIRPGSVADITVFDPELTWTVGEDGFESKAANSGLPALSLPDVLPTCLLAASRPSLAAQSAKIAFVTWAAPLMGCRPFLFRSNASVRGLECPCPHHLLPESMTSRSFRTTRSPTASTRSSFRLPSSLQCSSLVSSSTSPSPASRQICFAYR